MQNQISRRGLLRALAHVMIGSTLATVPGYFYTTELEPKWLSLERLQIPIRRLPSALEGFRIVQMSDFHLFPFTEIDLVREAVEAANNLKPDVVLLTGDYVLSKADSIFELAPVLAGLHAKYGVFACLGNHDLWTDQAVVRIGLEESGLPLLKNDGAAISVGRAAIYIAGLDDGWSGKPDLERALEHAPQGVPVVLLHHEPDFADINSRYGRVTLQLSGHSHGGQVRLPLIGSFVLPNYGRKYDMGLYRVNDMWLYTNRGIGVIAPPVRFNCRPEVTEITLVRGSS
ncbi:MAG: metallophosphoesterase [Anaerolineales bacterium]